jgi:hypothetical protein
LALERNHCSGAVSPPTGTASREAIIDLDKQRITGQAWLAKQIISVTLMAVVSFCFCAPRETRLVRSLEKRSTLGFTSVVKSEKSRTVNQVVLLSLDSQK